jgi:hypothetical protein
MYFWIVFGLLLFLVGIVFALCFQIQDRVPQGWLRGLLRMVVITLGVLAGLYLIGTLVT